MTIWIIALLAIISVLLIAATSVRILSAIKPRWVAMLLCLPWALWLMGASIAVAVAACVMAFPNILTSRVFGPSLVSACLILVGVPLIVIFGLQRRDGEPRATRWNYARLIVITAAAILLTAGITWAVDASVRAAAKQARSENDAQYLALIGPAIADEQNAADLYREALSKYSEYIATADREAREAVVEAQSKLKPDEELPPAVQVTPSELLSDPTANTGPRLTAAVSALAPVIDMLHRASTLPACRLSYPRHAPNINQALGATEDRRMVPKIAHFRWLAHALRADAVVSAQAGNTQRCLADLQAIKSLQKHVQDTEPNLISMLVGSGISVMRDEALASVLPHMSKIDPHLEALGTEFELLRHDVERSIRGELAMQTASMLDLADGRISSDHAESIYKLGMLYRIAYLTRDLDVLRRNSDSWIGLLNGQSTSLPWRNKYDMPTSSFAMFNAMPLERIVTGITPRTLASARAASICIALRRYQIDHGDYPQALTALVPAYLPQVPADPFDEAPMRYKLSANEVIVYSVGEDKKDDGGSIETETHRIMDTGLKMKR